MSKIFVIFDTAMCLLWIFTYTLVLIGTKKYQYPLISPTAQAIIAPFEFVAMILNIFASGLNYVTFAYTYWAIIEVMIFLSVIKSIKKNHIILYMVFTVIVTIITAYFVIFKSQMFLFSYLNTFVGMFFWFFHIKKKDYPIKPIVLLIFITKFIADIFAMFVYLNKGNWIINSMCILLPLLDFLFIVVYFKKRRLRHAL